MKKFIFALTLIPCLSYAISPVTPKEHEELMKGEMVRHVNWKEGYVWPEVSIRTLLKHKPDDSMKVFMNFEDQKNYIPDMLESKVVKKISPDNLHVRMSMKMPWPVNKSTHVTNNVISRENDGSVTLKWNLVGEATFLKATDGYVTFKPYNGKTMMEYVTFIVPNSSFAGMFKNKVPEDVKVTVEKIVERINSNYAQK